MRRLLCRLMPPREKVCSHPAARWMGPWIHHRALWASDRRSVCIGLAVGVFWGIVIPVAQMVTAGASAVALRGSVPAAVVGTFVSNPFTVPPLYIAAYFLGGLVLRGEGDVPLALLPNDLLSAAAWFDHLVGAGAPLFAGLFVLGSAGAVVTYVGLHFAWRLSIIRARGARRTLSRARRAEARVGDHQVS